MNKEINYVDLAKAIFEEHNKVRTDPSSYIEKLEEAMKHFKGDVLYLPGEDGLQTYEGKAAYEEAIEFLKHQNPVNSLTWDEKLTSACKDHIDDIGPKGVTSHDSSDGKNLSDRIEKYTEWDGACSENFDFGTKIAEHILMFFIVDDGLAERSQRKTIFNPEFNFIGIASGPHKEYGIGTVINYVSSVREIGEPSPDIKNFVSDYIKKSEEKKKSDKPKNAFQEDDADAPDNTVSVKIVKTTKIVKGKPQKVTRKIYQLEDGTQHIVEILDA